MKITKRQLQKIIKEVMTSYERDMGDPSPVNLGAWKNWIAAYGGTIEDLDTIAQYLGAPDRSWLGATPQHHPEAELYAALKRTMGIPVDDSDYVPPTSGWLDDDLPPPISESLDPSDFNKLIDMGNSKGGKDQVVAMVDSLGMNDILPDLRIWSLYDETSGKELIGGYSHDELYRIYKDMEQYLEGSWWDKDDEGQMTFEKVKKADFYDAIIGGSATKLEEDELEELLGFAASALELSSSRERVLSESADMISKLLQMDPNQAVAIITSLDSGNNDLLYAYSDAVEKEYNKAAKGYRKDPESEAYWLQKRNAMFDAIESL